MNENLSSTNILRYCVNSSIEMNEDRNRKMKRNLKDLLTCLRLHSVRYELNIERVCFKTL